VEALPNQVGYLILENLTPLTYYTLLITAKNNDLTHPRIMREDLMARLNIITRAEARTVNIVEHSSALMIVFRVLGVLLVLV